MSSRFFFQLGPIPADEGDFRAFFVDPAKEGAVTFFGKDEKTGIESILETYRADSLECEPALAKAAEPFAIKAGVITPERAHLIGWAAFQFAFPRLFDQIQRRGVIYQFGLACAEFWNAMPATRPHVRKPIQLSFKGSRESSYEGMILDGEVRRGLVLYPLTGSIERVEELAKAGNLNEAACVDSLGVGFREEPAFVIDAMRRAYALDRLPVPTHMKDGKPAVIEDLDLLSLSAALSAISGLGTERFATRSEITVDDLNIQAIARVSDDSKREVSV